MAAKKKSKKDIEKEQLEAGWVEGYEVAWIKQNPDHPDYKKVKKAAEKAKIW